ncbi:helix-turn-helix domain-containing protein [Anaeromyxobacter dehalogenans]|nr:helix-turn-helix domain-containing protein [Anaeromyxobacter dehalogenans]
MGDADRMAIEALRVFVRGIVREALAEAGAAAPRPEGFIGTAEAARRAGVKQETILAWIGKDLLPASRVEGAKGWKIRPADLEAVLGGQQTGSRPAASVADLAQERGRRLADSVKRRS